MALDDFLDPEPDCNWTAILRKKANQRDLTFDFEPRSRATNSLYFHVSSDDFSLLGATHNTREQNRESHIDLDYSEEVGLLHDSSTPPSKFGIENIREVVSIVIDHKGPGGYNENKDNFLVLTEQILRTLPDSGKKRFRVDSSGYPSPFNSHVNSWERLLEMFK